MAAKTKQWQRKCRNGLRVGAGRQGKLKAEVVERASEHQPAVASFELVSVGRCERVSVCVVVCVRGAGWQRQKAKAARISFRCCFGDVTPRDGCLMLRNYYTLTAGCSNLLATTTTATTPFDAALLRLSSAPPSSE